MASPAIFAWLSKRRWIATDYTNSIAKKDNGDGALGGIQSLGKSTFRYLTDDERSKWHKTARPTYSRAAGRVGQEMLDIIGKELCLTVGVCHRR
jgi:hypothetical protein